MLAGRWAWLFLAGRRRHYWGRKSSGTHAQRTQAHGRQHGKGCARRCAASGRLRVFSRGYHGCAPGGGRERHGNESFTALGGMIPLIKNQQLGEEFTRRRLSVPPLRHAGSSSSTCSFGRVDGPGRTPEYSARRSRRSEVNDGDGSRFLISAAMYLRLERRRGGSIRPASLNGERPARTVSPRCSTLTNVRRPATTGFGVCRPHRKTRILTIDTARSRCWSGVF